MNLPDVTAEVRAMAADIDHPAAREAEEYCDRAEEWHRKWETKTHAWQVKRALEDVDEPESVFGDFEDWELVLAAVFMVAWAKPAKAAGDGMLEELDAYDLALVTPAEVTRIIESYKAAFGDMWTTQHERLLRDIFDASFKRGETVVRAYNVLESLPRYFDVLEGMVNAAQFYGHDYFDSQVLPKLYAAVEKAFEDASDTVTAMRQVRKAIDAKMLSRAPYWHVVASANASHAYHYGLVQAGLSKGYRGYRLVAVLDSRTTDICRALNGKEFWLADALPVVERLASGDDPRAASPWITGEERRLLTENEVYDRAVYVPPFHGRCRTTMQLLP